MPKIKIINSLFIASLLLLFSCKTAENRADWKTIQPGTLGLSIDAPFELKEIDMQSKLPLSAKKKIKKMESFMHESKQGYYAISVVQFIDGVVFSKTAAVKGAVNQMRLKAGGEISNRKDETKMINGQEAAVTNATFSPKKGDEMDLQMAILEKDNTMYQVTALFKKGDNVAKRNSERIIASIKIN